MKPKSKRVSSIIKKARQIQNSQSASCYDFTKLSEALNSTNVLTQSEKSSSNGCYDFSKLTERLDQISKENEKEEIQTVGRLKLIKRITDEKTASLRVNKGREPTRIRRKRRRRRFSGNWQNPYLGHVDDSIFSDDIRMGHVEENTSIDLPSSPVDFSCLQFELERHLDTADVGCGGCINLF